MTSQLHVLVHPHYVLHLPHTEVLNMPVERFAQVDLRPSTARVANRYIKDPIVMGALKRQEALDRFYRAEIHRIAKQPGHKLVIVKHASEAKLNLPEPVLDLISGFQDRLITYARVKLRRRLLVMYDKPKAVGPALSKRFSASTPVRVFGEYSDACVHVTFKGLLDAGFSSVVHAVQKSVG